MGGKTIMGLIVLVVTLLGFGIYVKVSNYLECREQFSWLYCVTTHVFK